MVTEGNVMKTAIGTARSKRSMIAARRRRAKAPWSGAGWVSATNTGSCMAETRTEVPDRVKHLHNPKRRVGLVEFAARGRLVGAGAACGDFGHVVVFAFDGSSGEAAENR
jgi:hypothetical protein